MNLMVNDLLIIKTANSLNVNSFIFVQNKKELLVLFVHKIFITIKKFSNIKVIGLSYKE